MKLKKINIDFNEKGHAYMVEGELYTGVTTILDVRNKPFLKWWTAKEVVKFLENKQEQIKSATPEEYSKLLDEAKKAHVRKADTAKDAGTIAHEYVEHYIGEKLGTKGALVVPTENEEAKNAVNAFLNWEEKRKPEWIASELIVASIKHKYAGTLDFVAVIDGKFTLGDFKTNAQLSEDACLQTAGYWQALDEMSEDGETIDMQRMVVRLPKDGKEAEEWIIPTPIKFDVEIFNALRRVHSWNVNTENNLKGDNGKIKI